MKKILAAGLLVAPFTVAMAQSSVTLYGIVDAAVRRTNNEGPAGNIGMSQTQMIGGGMSQSSWGINVTEDMGDGLKAIANLENRFTPDNGAQGVGQPLFAQSWVGLQSSSLGRLTVGRQWNVLFDLVTSTYASFPYSPYMEAYKPELGMAMGARASNMLKYTAEYGPFRGSLQYSLDEGNKADPTTPLNATNLATIPGIVGGATKTAGGYLRYSANGISAGAGYLNTALPGGTKVDAWTVGGAYRTGPLYLNLGYALNERKGGAYGSNFASIVDSSLLGAYWSGSSNGGFLPGAAVNPAQLAATIGNLRDHANKREMFKVGIGYQITPAINLGGHYYNAKQSGSASGAFNGRAHFYVAVVDYAFSKRTDAYFGVDRTRVTGGTGMSLSVNGARTRTGMTVGLRHRF